MRCVRMLSVIAVPLLGFSLSYAAGVQSTPPISTETTPINVTDFITPDGRIDLAPSRIDGSQGPLRLDGSDVQIDPRAGSPVIPASVVSVSGHPDDIYWENDISSYSRIDYSVSVNCSIVYEGQLILGGAFTRAGVIEANHIVAWDGEFFSPLGLGTSDTVRALTVYDGKLIVAGKFDSAGEIPARGIASWDGSSWSALGGGINGNIKSLTVFDDRLIAGGEFTEAGGAAVHSVAQWNGTTWSALGDNLEGRVNTIAAYDGRLYAGGSFVIDADSLKRNLAYWDAGAWHTIVDTLRIPVTSMLVFDGRLVVSGYQIFAGWGFLFCNSLLSSWDGSDWLDIRSNLSYSVGSFHNDFVCAVLAVHDDQLLLSGAYVQGCYKYALMGWSGTEWIPVIDGLIHPGIGTLIDYDGGLVATGAFWSIDGVMASHAAILKGSEWYQLGGLEYRGTRLAIFNDKLVSAGRVVNGSSNYHYDYSGEIGLEAWDGISWSDYGPAFGFGEAGDYLGFCGGVYFPTALPVLPYGVYGGKLIISKQTYFDYLENQVCSWDEFAVSEMSGLPTSLIKTLITYHDKLIVAGRVRIGDYEGIAMWDGAAWSDMGISREDFVKVYPVNTVPVLTVFDDKLILNSSAETDHKLQVWDGSAWSHWGSGDQASIDSVLAMTTYGNTLIAGGSFTTAGGISANNIAFWDGESWEPLGDGLNGPVTALAIHNGRLIAGGNFTEAGGQPADNIAAWDGNVWSPLGSGVNGIVRQLLVYHDDLVVSGEFSLAGGNLSPFISVWTKKNDFDVVLDIKPGSCPNPINGNSAHGQGKAVMPVAIMGTADFDVHDINPTTVTLNGISPVRWNYQDVGSPPDDPDDECACSEAGPDGYTDLSLKFYSAEIVASLDGGNVVHVEGQLFDGTSFEGRDCVKLVGNSAMREVASDIPEREFELIGNYPNPFNPSTRILFYLPIATDVKLEIFNILGQHVITLIDRSLEAGDYSVIWDGSQAASGIYYYRLQAGGEISTNTMLLLK